MQRYTFFMKIQLFYNNTEGVDFDAFYNIVLMAYALHLKGLRLTRFKTPKAVDFIGNQHILQFKYSFHCFIAYNNTIFYLECKFLHHFHKKNIIL